jgi:hydroxypyruvate isomerase
MMKLAANCSLLFTEYPVLSRPDAARESGFGAIEFWWPFPTAAPSSGDIAEFCTAVEQSGLPLIGLNFFAGDMGQGDRGALSWTGREAEFRDNVDVVVAIGEQLGTRAFNALYGNRLDTVSFGAQRETALENLDYAAGALEKIGGTVLLEPVSGAPRYPLLTARDVVNVIDEFEATTHRRNVSLLADVYHLKVNGDDPVAALLTYRDRVGHVQVADAPGRHEPGTGTMDFDAILATLDQIGYDSWVAAEYIPSGPTADGLGWLGTW